MAIELTVEKSQEQAEILFQIGFLANMIDHEYMKEVGKAMKKQSHFQDSALILNPGHPQLKNRILSKEADAVNLLCDYIDSLKEIDMLKNQLSEEENIRDNIKKMFT